MAHGCARARNKESLLLLPEHTRASRAHGAHQPLRRKREVGLSARPERLPHPVRPSPPPNPHREVRPRRRLDPRPPHPERNGLRAAALHARADRRRARVPVDAARPPGPLRLGRRAAAGAEVRALQRHRLRERVQPHDRPHHLDLHLPSEERHPLRLETHFLPRLHVQRLDELAPQQTGPAALRRVPLRLRLPGRRHALQDPLPRTGAVPLRGDQRSRQRRAPQEAVHLFEVLRVPQDRLRHQDARTLRSPGKQLQSLQDARLAAVRERKQAHPHPAARLLQRRHRHLEPLPPAHPRQTQAQLHRQQEVPHESSQVPLQTQRPHHRENRAAVQQSPQTRPVPPRPARQPRRLLPRRREAHDLQRPPARHRAGLRQKLRDEDQPRERLVRRRPDLPQHQRVPRADPAASS